MFKSKQMDTLIIASLSVYNDISMRSSNHFVLKKKFIDLFNVLFISAESIRSTVILVGTLFSCTPLPLPKG